MDKSIDLGKLQSDLLAAKRFERNAMARNNRAWEAMIRAQSRFDACRQDWNKAKEVVDSLSKTVLEAARTVTAV